ncbi:MULTISPECIES: hypothetical protein [unclassified Mycolicibacterium]|uniref:hypothetical protein n=1 Tax=unclassified Mycolicibacterium TaxID=2636767 RepID=UPI0012DDA814|nr:MULTISPECIES: hypothetical protein [unclassified Mycolicibacterium]MUL85190.1 hypothetical protein [Mycolicibacterium sp. CBMA 329]MUL91157.1 hypothetical protein [Mycolicibacterium sp. CBMA 331]MUL98174.1 hypothetical protein [Mycolicibacterium sp. CBMA 334]MUM26057.1 hypothetical protein [Mycolicibacterium sp. CBMA 295]MUM40916.1 hypothetical protein [Mycolicibacterium sp. CBMA 247]
MSVFNPGSVVKREATQQTPSGEHSHEPVLITEQQVLFSTAAAAGSPTRRSVIAMMSQVVSSVAEHRHARAERRRARYYPSRLTYLEHSLMAREMDRL